MATYTSQPDGTTGIDVLIYEQAPTDNFGTLAKINAGDYDGSVDLERILIKFDLTSIPVGSTVSSAILSLFVANEVAANDATLLIYRVRRAWVETQATWNAYTTGNNWSTAGCGNTTTDREATNVGNSPVVSNTVSAGTEVQIVLDNTSVEEMIDGDFTNNGWLIKTSAELNDVIEFHSSDGATSGLRPKLVIEYAEPTTTSTTTTTSTSTSSSTTTTTTSTSTSTTTTSTSSSTSSSTTTTTTSTSSTTSTSTSTTVSVTTSTSTTTTTTSTSTSSTTSTSSSSSTTTTTTSTSTSNTTSTSTSTSITTTSTSTTQSVSTSTTTTIPLRFVVENVV